MSFVQFLRSKVFWLNVLLAIVITALLIVILMWALTFYTRSGRTIIVPDLTGYTVRQVKEQISNAGLDYVVIDSIHKTDIVPGVIVEQIPRAGKSVKKGRKLFLTINCFTNEMVEMPQLVDYSLRNAQVVLETAGLRVGQITYKPSEYSGLVLGQMYDGKQIKAGVKIPKGTSVQLIVGSGRGGSSVVVPELIGLTFAEAKITIDDASLVLGSSRFEGELTSAKDSATSVVYKQSPSFENGQIVNVGTPVNIWLTKNMDMVIDAMEEIENSRGK